MNSVLVGGGTAGSVLAARLTEDDNVKVVVLEAGEEETKYPLHYIPLMLFFLQNTEADWAYRTVPQKKACLGLKEQVRPFSQYIPWSTDPDKVFFFCLSEDKICKKITKPFRMSEEKIKKACWEQFQLVRGLVDPRIK